MADVALVHGLSGSTLWWRRNTGAIRESHRVHLIDLPGFGSMRQRGREFSVAGAAQWLAARLDAVEFERGAVVGHSMGGLISAMLAARRPDLVDRLVLVAPAIALPQRTIRGNLLPLASAGWLAGPQFMPILVWDAARAGLQMLFRSANELLAMDVEAEVAMIRCPCLVIMGERDPLVPPSVGEALCGAIPRSELAVIPHAGHIVMFDQADAFNRTVLRFLHA